MNLTKLK